MKYFLLLSICILTSCSLDKHSAYWNDDTIKRSLENNKNSNISKKTSDIKTMTFEEFNLILREYSDKAEYPDINN
jgi:hypothetical protein|tara:strand:+ start:125 stop:349 length:225 start_codon:yes stop_codon:yes gene_type:complete